MIRTASILGALSILALLGAAPVACSSKAPAHAGAQALKPTLHVVNEAPQRGGGSGVIGVIGSYGAACNGGVAGQSWALAAPGGDAAMASITSLSAPGVSRDDSLCRLEIDSIYTAVTTTFGSGYVSTNQPTPLYVTGTDVTTANTYLPSAIAFDDPSPDAGDDPVFYANAQSTVVDQSGDFSLTLLVGDDPNVGTSSFTATAVSDGGSDDGG